MAAAEAFSPSATVTCFLKLAGDVLADFEDDFTSDSNSIRVPKVRKSHECVDDLISKVEFTRLLKPNY